ncbi:MAG: ABC transporter ATP-binding protein [Firmicutes bacterium]|nr:ABC transporter ATP-binding protein [Bacillota bacterium]
MAQKNGQKRDVPPLPSMRPGGRRGPRGMPVEKAKDVRGTVRRLWQYFSGQGRALGLLVLLVLIGTGAGLAIPYLIGRAIDFLSPQYELSLLSLVVGALLFTYLLDALIRFGQNYLMASVSQGVVLKLRRALFAKLQVLPLAFFDKHTHGEVMSRLANDLDNVSEVVAQSTIQLASSTLMIGGSFALMLLLSPLLTLASMITIPLVFLVAKYVTGKTRRYFRTQQRVLGELNGYIEEMVSGVTVVKAFNREERVIADFNQINGELRDVGVKAQVWSGFLMPLMNVIGNLGFAAVAGVGGVLAIRGLVTVGIIASFLSYSRQFVRPLNEVASIYNLLQSALASAERVFEILDEKQEPADQPDAREIRALAGEISFENVSFSYEEGVEVLRDVSFRVPAGSSLAIVGATGSGKTTIVNLLTRYYDLKQGCIKIDGLDLRRYKRDSLRSCFGVVLQDTHLFSGTVADNIRYGRLEASPAEIKEAAKLAKADGFIRRLPQGYKTELRESGSGLSQGERQLLAISRALLADPKILILDEATSSVDTRTELQIQEALAQLMEGRTSIIVAHRLSTIRDADQILLLDQGRVLEMGRHEELLARRGAYYRLYSSQFTDAG